MCEPLAKRRARPEFSTFLVISQWPRTVGVRFLVWLILRRPTNRKPGTTDGVAAG